MIAEAVLREFVVAAFNQVASTFLPNIALRILVLGDPLARTCQALAAKGHAVHCCPDLQVVLGAEHVCLQEHSLTDLITNDTRWDVIIAVEGFRRIQFVHSEMQLQEVMWWMSTHSHISILEAPRIVLAPDLHDLGPYRIQELFHAFEFVSELDFKTASVAPERPILLASNAGIFHDGHWRASDEFVPLQTNPNSMNGAVSTYSYDGHILKVERSNGQYFQRCEASAEANFLSHSTTELRLALDLPEVFSVHSGRAVSTMMRATVPGQVLRPGICGTQEVPIGALITWATTWAAAGVFHNDLRPWNLLWDGEKVRAIDFADSGYNDLDVQDVPQIFAFASTIAAALHPEIRWGEYFFADIMRLAPKSAADAHRYSESMFQAPWLALPDVAIQLTAQLENSPDLTPSEVIDLVIDICTDAAVRRRNG